MQMHNPNHDGAQSAVITVTSDFFCANITWAVFIEYSLKMCTVLLERMLGTK
jgi:hypothetical protein